MANSITLDWSENCSATIHLYGATVTSWINNGKEQLFLSSKSKMDGSKAIRGGIPLVFPNFGPWEHGPQHGFARISWWKIIEQPTKMSNCDVTTVLQLTDDDKTRNMWNHQFLLTYKVTLGENNLTTKLEVTNTGSEQFDFTVLLHTYFRVSDINSCKVSGFLGCNYSDKVEGTDNVSEASKEIVIDRNIDRVYRLAGQPDGHLISTPETKLMLTKINLPDTVLWNPWTEKAAAMSDFDDLGYLNMVCVEPGYVSQRKILHAGETLTCSQNITVL